MSLSTEQKIKVQCLLTEYLDLGRWRYMVMWSVRRAERQATTKWRDAALDVVAGLRVAAFVGDICLVERDPDTCELHKLDLETGMPLETKRDASKENGK